MAPSSNPYVREVCGYDTSATGEMFAFGLWAVAAAIEDKGGEGARSLPSSTARRPVATSSSSSSSSSGSQQEGPAKGVQPHAGAPAPRKEAQTGPPNPQENAGGTQSPPSSSTARRPAATSSSSSSGSSGGSRQEGVEHRAGAPAPRKEACAGPPSPQDPPRQQPLPPLAGRGSEAEAAELAPLLLSLARQLLAVAGGGAGGPPRHRFLQQKYYERLPADFKANCDALVASTIAINALAAGCGAGGGTVEAIAVQIRCLVAHAGTLTAAVNNLNDGVRHHAEFRACSAALVARLQTRVDCTANLLKIACGAARGDESLAAAAREALRTGTWGPDQPAVDALLARHGAAAPVDGGGAAAEDLARIQRRLAEAVSRAPNGLDALREERQLATGLLESMNVPETVVYATLQGVNAAITRAMKGEEARSRLKAAISSLNADAIQQAISFAEDVAMKDVDGTLHDAEHILEDIREVSSLKAGLSVTPTAATDDVLQAILAANRFLKKSGIYLEKQVQYDANGKVIPVTEEYDVYVDHFNNHIWTADCTVLYQEACITYQQRRRASGIAEEIRELLELPDDDFVRSCQSDGLFSDVFEKCDDQSYGGADRKQLEKRVDTLMKVRAKAFFPQGDIKILSVPQRIPLRTLHARLVDEYKEDNPELDDVAFKISYVDQDNDRIRLATDRDWVECVSLKRDQCSSALLLSSTATMLRPGETKIELYLDYNFGGATVQHKSPRTSRQSHRPAASTAVLGSRTPLASALRSAPRDAISSLPVQEPPVMPGSGSSPPSSPPAVGNRGVPGHSVARHRASSEGSPAPAPAPHPGPTATTDLVRRQSDLSACRGTSANYPSPPPAPEAMPFAPVSRWGVGCGAMKLPEVPDASFIAAKKAQTHTAIEDAALGRGLPPASSLYPDLDVGSDTSDEGAGPTRWQNFKAKIPDGVAPLLQQRAAPMSRAPYRRSGVPLERRLSGPIQSGLRRGSDNRLSVAGRGMQ
ncbi:hypothetical protein DIPPA_17255 [Diplonema papillatum]|nr:hypothetical protein DIPPA_17255 [Diplonema papillatum]